MILEKSSFDKAIALWREWNEKINVISRKDIEMIYEHHILHSLSILRCDMLKPGDSVLDVGTGGGFPGIPLAMALPDCKFTLCDSIGKKIKVAQAVCDGVGLQNAICVNARAESLPDNYDWVVSRAVTSLDAFYPWVKGKYRKGIICLKGGDVVEEISVLCRKFRINPSKVSTISLADLTPDGYYDEKYIVVLNA